MSKKNIKPSILGLITARGGSKGIPGKNIKELAGKPLIAYTIEAALASGVFDRVILSTDDEKIADVATSYGCEVPFMRPKELAQDNTPHPPVILHALAWLRDHNNYQSDQVMILQPTAPLRSAAHIQEAVALMRTGSMDSLVSISAVPSHFHPQWQFVIDNNNYIKIFTGDPFSKLVPRRQELSQTYFRNGAIYIFKKEFLLNDPEANFYGNHVAAYIMKPEESVNLDTLEDWQEAEKILATMR